MRKMQVNKKRGTPTFPEFWEAYGFKRDRIGAEKAFLRLSAKDRLAAFNGIAAYREDCQRRGVAMRQAQGYINHRRWEDERSPVESVAIPSQPSSSPTPCSQPDMEIW